MLRLILIGFGSVNQVLLDLLQQKQKELQLLLNKKIVIVGVSDSCGAIYNANGINMNQLLSTKKNKGSVIYYNGNNTVLFSDSTKMLSNINIDYDMIIDGSPAHLNIGLKATRIALQNNKRAVLANKKPLVDAFAELHNIKYVSNMRYSAAVCGGLPVVNILKHDLMIPYLSNVSQIIGIFNSTSNYILTQLTENINNPQITMDVALKEAQDIGIAETDPLLDINGTDTANKLCIIMNIVGVNVKFNDINRSGLETVNRERIIDGLKDNKVYKMIAQAKRKDNNEWILSVSCKKVSQNSFLGQCRSTDMCIQIETDLFDTQYFKTNEKDVVGTSSAVLRDIISLSLNDKTYSNNTLLTSKY